MMKLCQFYNKFKCSKSELSIKIKERAEFLSRREWTAEEDQQIILNLENQMSLKDLRTILICRDNTAIASRKEEIKKYFKNIERLHNIS